MSRPRKIERASADNAGPINKADTLGKVDAKYSEEGEPASVTTFPRDWKARRSTAAIRLAELIRLAQGRRGLGLLVDPHLFAWTLAATLGSVAAGPYTIPKRQRCLRWHGLTSESLRHAVNRAELGEFSDDELQTVIREIERGHAAHGPGLIRAAKLGDLLQVTAAEREAFKIRTIDATDETREARQDRLAADRRARDAERKRAERGRIPWPAYQARSLSAQKPWEAEGICRRTWERRRRRVASVSEHVLSSSDVGHVCDTRDHSVNEEGDVGSPVREPATPAAA